MTKTTLVRIGVCAALASIVACSAAKNDGPGSVGEQQSGGGHAHIMPKHGPQQASPKLGAPLVKLTDHGGPVISNVKIVDVFWGSGATTNETKLEGYYTAITKSPYFDWLKEYNTSTQTIGEGSFVKSVVDTGASTATTIDDSQIQTEIVNLIAAGKVPANDANTLYMFYFAPNVTITLQGSASCQVFCAYHGTATNGAGNVYYGVMPDLSSNGCESGCGNNATVFDNLTEVSSHEMIEAVTDSAVGINNLAWYDDPDNQEIGDLCVGQSGSVAGYTIQLEWSNSQGGCIATNGTTTNDFTLSASPTSGSVQDGSSTSFNVSTALSSGNAETVKFTISGLPTGVTAAFNPTSTTSNGGSSTLTVKAAANAPASNSTLTITGTAPSATHTTTVGLTVTGGGGTNLVADPGFENALSGWIVHHSVSDQTSVVHGGTHAAQIGSTTSSSGWSILTQYVTLPATGTSTLSFWTNFHCADSKDAEKVRITDASGHMLKQVLRNCLDNHTWAQTTLDVSAFNGTKIGLQFSDLDDGLGKSLWYLDDVSVTNQ